MTSNVKKFDIVIVGGGLSGCLAALALSNICTSSGKQLAIAIVEANDVTPNGAIKPTPVHFDSRVLALSHGSASYLKALAVWPLMAGKAEAINTIHISDRGFYGKARVYAADHQVDALGYVIEMSVLGDALLKALVDKANVTWFAPNLIEEIDWQTEQVNITLNDNTQLSASLLLGCDGGQSQCRQYANIAAQAKDYQQTAVIANVRFTKPHHNIAYERFTEHGPIAVLPLAESSENSQKCSLVWTTTPQNAQRLEALNDKEFADALNQAFGYWLGEVEHAGRRFSYPLSLVTANEQIYHRTVLVGNASHTIHPIAGQGFNLGLRDVSELATVIETQLARGEDFTSFSQLSAYGVERAKDHQQVIQLTDSLVTLFSNTLPPLVVGRNLGVKVLNYCQGLKSTFVDKTMGY